MTTEDETEAIDPYKPPEHPTGVAEEPRPGPAKSRYPTIAASITLFVLTAAACWAAGGVIFAVTIFAIAGAHAFGHFYVARRHGIECSGPYFAPYPTPFGISGAFLQMRWPIRSRRALVQVFLAGPVMGLTVSVLAIIVGLQLSEVVDLDSGLYFEFGTSILASVLEHLLIGDPTDADILLSPIAFAGWLGIYLNSWQLLPIGRFDGGRVLAAVIGYWNFVPVSVVILVVMMVASMANGTQPYLAMVGLATHWRLKEQLEGMEYEPLPRGQAFGALAVLAVLLVLTYPLFSPNFSFG